jgi:hypothetical protein
MAATVDVTATITVAAPIPTIRVIITGVDITGVGRKPDPIVNDLGLARRISGPGNRVVIDGPDRELTVVTGAGSAGATIVVQGAGGKNTPVTGIGTHVRTVDGPGLSRELVGPKVGPE